MSPLNLGPDYWRSPVAQTFWARRIQARNRARQPVRVFTGAAPAAVPTAPRAQFISDGSGLTRSATMPSGRTPDDRVVLTFISQRDPSDAVSLNAALFEDGAGTQLASLILNDEGALITVQWRPASSRWRLLGQSGDVTVTT